MALLALTRNQMLDALDEAPVAPAAGITHVSLHTDAYPQATGGNEVTGGSPAYARRAVIWDAASAGSKALSAAVTFDVPGGVTIRRAGFWSAATAGTYFGDSDIPDEAYASQGTYQLTAATLSVT